MNYTETLFTMCKEKDDLADKIRHEYTLTNNRVNWLITSQTIFFGIYAIVYSNQEVINRLEFAKVFQVIPWVGLASCTVIYISILAAIWATRIFVIEADDASLLGPKLTYSMGLAADIFLPMVFISTWLYILKTNMAWPICVSAILLIINVWGLRFTEKK